jgi:hypothetical protein
MNNGTDKRSIDAEFHLDIQHKKNYLHITVTGKNSPETVSAFLESILEECSARKCQNILVEERLEGPRLSFSEIVQIASEASQQAAGRIQAFAYVDVNAEDDSMRFAELVARNRAMPVRVFSSVPEAEAWIQAESENVTELNETNGADR